MIIRGTIEADWFLSRVQLTSPTGEEISIPASSETKVGRLIVTGTNWAFVEVIGGELACSLSAP